MFDRAPFLKRQYLDRMKEISDLKTLTDFLDTRYRGPLGFRFGWDALLGLIPVVGDLVTSGLSLYIIFRAAALDCPPVVLLRMGMNILIENVIDMIPVIGNIFDFAWKSNLKNMALLDSHLRNPVQTRRSSRFFIWLTALLVLLLIFAVVIGSFYLIRLLFMSIAQ